MDDRHALFSEHRTIRKLTCQNVNGNSDAYLLCVEISHSHISAVDILNPERVDSTQLVNENVVKHLKSIILGELPEVGACLKRLAVLIEISGSKNGNRCTFITILVYLKT